MTTGIRLACGGVSLLALTTCGSAAPAVAPDAALSASVPAVVPRKALWVLFNEDSGHFLEWVRIRHPGKPFTRAFLHEYCDRYLGGVVTHYLVNVNSMVAWYDSKALEWRVRVHDRLGKCGLSADKSHDRDIEILRQMAQEGLDPYAAFLARAREKGVVPWLSMRMNDIHHVLDEDNCATAFFWKEHPEYRTDPDEPAGPASRHWGRGLSFDYRHAAVRKRHLDGLAEMLARYEADGIELDFMRHPTLFRPGHELEDAHFLTEFMREARRIVNAESARKGRRLTLAVRIASRPKAAQALGCDFETWAREGLVDVVIASNDFMTQDGGLSTPEWKALIAAANPKVRFIPGTDTGLAPECWWNARRGVTPTEQNGWIERHLADGAEGFYFFNCHYGEPSHPQSRFLLEDAWTLERLAARPRDYPVTVCDAAPTPELRGDPFGSVGAERRDVKVLCGRRPDSGEVRVVLAFSCPPRPATMQSVRLNGAAPLSVAAGAPDAFSSNAKERKGNGVVVAAFPVTAMRSGENVVSVLGDGQPDGRLHSCRIEVRP